MIKTKQYKSVKIKKLVIQSSHINNYKIKFHKIYTNKLGLSRTLYKIIETSGQQKLKENGYLTRNSLCKERRSLNRQLFILQKNSNIKKKEKVKLS